VVEGQFYTEVLKGMSCVFRKSLQTFLSKSLLCHAPFSKRIKISTDLYNFTFIANFPSQKLHLGLIFRLLYQKSLKMGTVSEYFLIVYPDSCHDLIGSVFIP